MKSQWIPATILALGAVLTLGAAQQRALPLQRPLGEVIPTEIDGYSSQELFISEAEAEIAGFSNYLFRVYERPAVDSAGWAESDPGDRGTEPTWFSLYVGYYESQAQGKTIHSPKNCLPGAGWEALSSETLDFEVDGKTVTVNRFILQNGSERSVALYWYQGRGRIAHDEYQVKWNLLRDAASRRRSDEALVRIIVPLEGGDQGPATDLAVAAAKRILPTLENALPR